MFDANNDPKNPGEKYMNFMTFTAIF